MSSSPAPFFVGLDSDGCVFDTMDVKQREHFFPNIVRHWHLETIADAVLRAVVFVNLESRHRGQNRFPCLLRVFESLATIPGVRESGVALPDLAPLRAYVDSGVILGNPTLKEAVRATGDPELERVYAWSLAVNESIDRTMRPVPPFRGALRALALLRGRAKTTVVSQTPQAALVREWNLHGIADSVDAIPGQEGGTKAEQLRKASAGIPHSHCVMLGDAPADAHAADEAGVLFFPILPDREEESWTRFCDEAWPRLQAETYAGPYCKALRAEFDSCLPSDPPWK